MKIISQFKVCKVANDHITKTSSNKMEKFRENLDNSVIMRTTFSKLTYLIE